MQYIWYVVVGVAALALGILFGILIRKSVAESKIKSAEAEAKRIVDDAVKTAEARKKEILVEAKEDILKAKTEAERENKERRQELIRLENRALSKEETLDRKLENYERRSEALDKSSRMRRNPPRLPSSSRQTSLPSSKKLQDIRWKRQKKSLFPE